MLSDEAADLKRGSVSDFLLAEHSVVDPQICVTLPPGPTGYTGMDTLTHAIEAYTNRFAVPLIYYMAHAGRAAKTAAVTGEKCEITS